MKKILLLLLALIPLQAAAQIELVRPADFRYHVTVDGDTVSSRSLDYKAIQDAVEMRYQFPTSQIIVHPLGMEVRGSFPAGGISDTVTIRDTLTVSHINTVYHSITDTVYVPADTVYINQSDTLYVESPADTLYINETVKQYDNSYGYSDVVWHPDVQNFNFEVRQAVGDTTGSYRIAIDGTTGASAVSVATNCYGWDGASRTDLINERTSGRADTDSTGYARWESGELRCQGIMTYWITERDSGNFSVWFADIGQIMVLN